MKKTLGALAVGVATISLIVGLVAPASASAVVTSTTNVSALEKLGLLNQNNSAEIQSAHERSDISSRNPSGRLSTEDGLSVKYGSSTVTMSPIVDSQNISPRLEGSALEYSADKGSSYVFTGAGTAANAGYVVITDPSGPTSYQFQIEVNGGPARLALKTDGSVQIADMSGVQVNVVLPAWAKDANGAPVETSYTVEGSVITQIVQHKGAAYPVVADPGLACDLLFCTYEYSADQTSQIANADPTLLFLIDAGCAAVGGPVGGFSCGFASVSVTDVAGRAVADGQCLGVRKLNTSPIAFPVEVPCS